MIVPNLRHLTGYTSGVTPLLGLIIALGVNEIHARNFTGHTGTNVEAEVASVSLPKSTARLRLPSGQEYDVPFANVSAADQAYLRQWKPASAPAPAVPTAAPSTTPSLIGRAPSGGLPVKPSTTPLGAPGETLTFEFPELSKERSGAVAACKVRLPDQYDPTKPMPLLLWFAGGDGSNNPAEGLNLVDGGTFAIAAMPYPISVQTPQKAVGNKDMDSIRDFHMAMLKKLAATLTNVDARLRFAGGMSNGAHVVGTYLANGERDFIEYFNAFIIIEGGCTRTDAKKTLRNKYAYLGWGDAPGNTEGYMEMMKSSAKDAHLKVVNRVMPGVGHGFPDEEKREVRKWIETVACPGLAAAKA